VGPQHCDGYPAVGDRPAVNLFCCLPCPDPALQGVRTDGGVTCVPVTSQSVCGGSVDHVPAATIHVTASTNSAPVDVVVYCDASAERTLGPPKVAVGRVTPKTFPAGSPEVAKFLADLDAAGDVSSFTIYEYPAPGTVPGCAKSASFGTVTTLSVQGKTSGDIQCMTWPSAAQAALASDCDLLASVP
jgi:hypothetical protein